MMANAGMDAAPHDEASCPCQAAEAHLGLRIALLATHIIKSRAVLFCSDQIPVCEIQ